MNALIEIEFYLMQVLIGQRSTIKFPALIWSRSWRIVYFSAMNVIECFHSWALMDLGEHARNNTEGKISSIIFAGQR